jgi:CRP-like cAMP-binding protein
MIDLFMRQLERHTMLDSEAKDALRAAPMWPRRLAAHQDLMKHEDSVVGVFLVLQGVACRYARLPSGRRQILSYLVPGDLCGIRACVLGHADHSVASISRLEATFLPRASVAELTSRFPQLLRAFWTRTMVEDLTMREWLMNVGHRPAFERMAHFLCEMFTRLEAAGLTNGDSCELPLRQGDLADALALTSVHVNRVLMMMRRLKLVTFQQHHLVIHDFEALQRAAGFSPDYLQIGAVNRLRADAAAGH